MYHTSLSKILLHCWAFTKFIFIVLGFLIAFWIAVFVISWKVILGVFSGNFKVLIKCHAIASHSLSSSVAKYTLSCSFANFFNWFITFFFHFIITYSGEKLFLISIPNLLSGRSSTCQILATTSKSFHKYFWMVLAFAGDSTITKFFHIKLNYFLKLISNPIFILIIFYKLFNICKINTFNTAWIICFHKFN